MQTFFNQATLTYNNIVTTSNIVQGELVEVLSAAKTSVTESYRQGDTVTYVVSIVNTGTTPYTGLTLTDNLGAYEFNGNVLTPLTYVDESVKYYVNGTLQAAPAVTAGPPLTISGINVPAGGNAVIVYSASVNQFAPTGTGSLVTNEAIISGSGLSTPITVQDTITTIDEILLAITKGLSPATVAENGQLTYTFVIQNFGSQPAEADDNAVITDTFNPILNPITVTYNGTTWTEGTNYTYDETTGEFATLPGQITVPAATFEQDPVTGAWVSTPGSATVTVIGTV